MGDLWWWYIGHYAKNAKCGGRSNFCWLRNLKGLSILQSPVIPKDGLETIPLAHHDRWMTGDKFSNFHESKSGMEDPTSAQFEKWWHANKPVKVFWQENSRENKKLEAGSDKEAWMLNAWPRTDLNKIT